MGDYKPGDQIAYLPNHVEGDVFHKDVEFGFVTSTKDGKVFCRFWLPDEVGIKPTLRTKNNSEACNRENLLLFRKYHESVIEKAWKKYVSELGLKEWTKILERRKADG